LPKKTDSVFFIFLVKLIVEGLCYIEQDEKN
jgi:hypothetical protein